MNSSKVFKMAWLRIALVASLGPAAMGLATAAPAPEVVASGLENPWGVGFLPDGRFLVTEKAGRIRVVGADGKLGAPLAGLPAIASGGQGGLLDVLVDSAFAKRLTPNPSPPRS